MTGSLSARDVAEIHAKVEEVWKVVLEVPTVQMGDDFFGLGGDSLKAVELIVGVEAMLNVSIDPVEIIEYPVYRDFLDFTVRVLERESATDTAAPETPA